MLRTQALVLRCHAIGIRALALALAAGLLAAPLTSTLARADVVEEEPEEIEVPPPPPPPPPRGPAPEPAPPPPPPEPQAKEECTWLPDLRCGRHGRWEGFERPIVQPFLFEDPFITTGVYPHYVWHEFPGSSALRGDHVQVFAIQARIALTDRLALIFTKDGRVWEDPENPALKESKGFLNLAAGLKYALLQLPEEPFILSGILKLEVPTGSSDVLEGSDGAVLFMPQLSAAWSLDRFDLPEVNLMADFGSSIPSDGSVFSSNIFGHLYADYEVHRHFQPFTQFSWIHYIESGAGDRPIRIDDGPDTTLSGVQDALDTGPFEGVDLHNLGSEGIDNADFATWSLGAHFPLNKHVTISAAYERPLTNRKDIFKQRFTSSVRLEF